MGFSNVLDEAEIHAVSKIWESKHFKVKCFLNFSYEAEIHAVPKIYEKWISLLR